MACWHKVQLVWVTSNILRDKATGLHDALQRAASTLGFRVHCREYLSNEDVECLAHGATKGHGDTWCLVVDSKRRAKNCLRALQKKTVLMPQFALMVHSGFDGVHLLRFCSQSEVAKLEMVQGSDNSEDLVSRVMLRLHILRAQAAPQPNSGSSRGPDKHMASRPVSRVETVQRSGKLEESLVPRGAMLELDYNPQAMDRKHHGGISSVQPLAEGSAGSREVDFMHEREPSAEPPPAPAELLPASRFWGFHAIQV